MTNANYCPQCGTAVQSEAQFCTNCGRLLAAQAPQAAQSPPGAQAPGTGTPGPVAAAPPPPQAIAAFDERSYAIFLHLAAFAGVVVPFGNILGPLILWMARRQDSSLVDRHGKMAVNFQISMTLYLVLGFVAAVASAIMLIFLVGIVLLPVVILAIIGLVITWFVAVIRAAVRAGKGREPGYPLVVRFVRR